MSTDFGFKATTSGNYYFVSYNSEDADRVAEICRYMNEDGLPIWYDEGIPHDSYWEKVLAERIDQCKEAIFFITKGIFDKGHERELKDIYTYKEYNLARIYEKKVLIVMLDQISPKVDVPYGLMSWWQEIEPGTRQGVLAFNDPPNIVKRNIFKAINFNTKVIYTKDDDIKEPLFNSVINHPIFGDEREFIHIRKVGEKDWKREMELEAGGQYEVKVCFRNDGNPEYNSSDFGNATVACQTRMAIDVPHFVYGEYGNELTACIMWEKQKQKCLDSIVLQSKDGRGKLVHPVLGQAKVYNKWEANESVLSSNLFSFRGTYIGLNRLNGVILAGDDYAGCVKFYIDVERKLSEDSIEIVCQGSLDGENWYEGLIQASASQFVTIKTIIKNNATENLAGAVFAEQISENCILRDSAFLYTNSLPSGRKFNAKCLIAEGIEVGINKGSLIQIINQVQVNGHIGDIIPLKSQLTFFLGEKSVIKSLSIELI